MSSDNPKSREERIQHALSRLVETYLPPSLRDDDAQFDDAYSYAVDVINRLGEGNRVADVGHTSGLIKAKLQKGNRASGPALEYTNLVDRLLAQPVLDNKGSMLHLLYKLADTDVSLESVGAQDGIGFEEQEPYEQRGGYGPGSRDSTKENFVVDAPAFNEAFSKPGLLKLPVNEGMIKSRSAALEKGKRPPKSPDKRSRLDSATPDTNAVPTRGTVQPPSETALLRDLPFTLQGLSSTNLAFASSETLKLPASLPIPLVSLLHTLAEPSLLYRGLTEFVESTEGGLIGQSFRSALDQELRAYLGLVATLEGQIRRALAMLDETQLRGGIGKAGVTLKRCVIWIRDATMGLRLMKLMVEQSRGKKGGQLISLIHSFSLTHGDPFVGSFAERLLSHVTRPFYDMLRQWIYDGELADPHMEFFVSEHHNEETESEINGEKAKSGATSVWQDKYQLDPRMIPSIITEEFANKVFLIGKTLNFIRHGCGDAAWVERYSKGTSKELKYGDTATLERSIGEAYITTMAQLTHLMADKFALFEHLRALKKYLLLGAGDFVALLMESLAVNLDRPANTQFRHTLTAQLEHAVRNSNAQHDSADVLRRLDARMLELSHGEIGWDVFTLEYKIDAPVDVIVTPFGTKQYLKVFNFLWRVKRVEFALGTTWRRSMTGARGILGSVADKLGVDWKIARCAIAEMVHFVNQLQYYILFEVIEASWNELQIALQKPEATLDDMIQAHDNYLNNITRKGLLGSSGGYEFTSQLHELLKVMLHYKDVVDGLYSFSVAEFTRRQERSAKIETRTAAGKWGITERDDRPDTPNSLGLNPTKEDKKKARPDSSDSPFPLTALMTASVSNEDDILDGLRKRLKSLSIDFRAKINVLLGDLYSQPDADMRWLAMVMNFNDMYQPVRRRRKARSTKEVQTPMEKGKEATATKEKVKA